MQKSPLRQAESRIHRFGQNQLMLRADSGFGMPTGPGMDREGFLARNPLIKPSSVSSAGAGRGRINPASVTPEPEVAQPMAQPQPAETQPMTAGLPALGQAGGEGMMFQMMNRAQDAAQKQFNSQGQAPNSGLSSFQQGIQQRSDMDLQMRKLQNNMPTMPHLRDGGEIYAENGFPRGLRRAVWR